MKEKRKMKYPHDNVKTRLGASQFGGAGVFAILPIKKGEMIYPEDANEKMVRVPEAVVNALPEPLQKLYKDFGILEDGKYYAPKSFNTITPTWYFNHSRAANVVTDEGVNFYAARDIQPGEELTADYRTYNAVKDWEAYF